MNNHDPNMHQCESERRYGLADFVVLSAAICLSLVTWAALADAAKVGEWKSIIEVVLTLFLALTALTRHPRCAIIFRLLTGGCIAATPYLGVPAHRLSGLTYRGEAKPDVTAAFRYGQGKADGGRGRRIPNPAAARSRCAAGEWRDEELLPRHWPM
jgi:hypothetical protein